MTAVVKATAEAEANHKEDAALETEIDLLSGDIKEVDLTAVTKATAEKGRVFKEDSAEEKETDDVETNEVDLMALAKATTQREAIHKRQFCRGNRDTDGGSGKKQRYLI